MSKLKPITSVVLAAVLSGCGHMMMVPIEDSFTPAPKVKKVRVEWIATEDPIEACKQLFPDREHWDPLMLACAVWSDDHTSCTIVTKTKTNHQILGHEIRHCFEGNFHE